MYQINHYSHQYLYLVIDAHIYCIFFTLNFIGTSQELIYTEMFSAFYVSRFSASLCLVRFPDSVGSLTLFRLKKPNLYNIKMRRIKSKSPTKIATIYIQIETPAFWLFNKSGYAIVSA